jgi:hypothetical protein
MYLNDSGFKSFMPEQKCKIKASGRSLWIGVSGEFKKLRGEQKTKKPKVVTLRNARNF